MQQVDYSKWQAHQWPPHNDACQTLNPYHVQQPVFKEIDVRTYALKTRFNARATGRQKSSYIASQHRQDTSRQPVSNTRKYHTFLKKLQCFFFVFRYIMQCFCLHLCHDESVFEEFTLHIRSIIEKYWNYYIWKFSINIYSNLIQVLEENQLVSWKRASI